MSDINEEIAVAAYYIWEAEGRPDGRADEHWAMACARIMPVKKTVAKKASAPKAVKSKTAPKTAAKKTKTVSKTDAPKVAPKSEPVKEVKINPVPVKGKGVKGPAIFSPKK